MQQAAESRQKHLEKVEDLKRRGFTEMCIRDRLRGVRPFFSDKYDITKHPNYKYLSDHDKKNTFDMEKHLRRRPALVKPDEVFDY